MLRGAADAQRQVHLGLNRFARLPYQAGGGQPALVNHRAGAAQGGSQGVDQLVCQLDVILALDAASDGHQQRLAGDIHISGGRLDVLFQSHPQPVQGWRRQVLHRGRYGALTLFHLELARQQHHQRRFPRGKMPSAISLPPHTWLT